MNQKIGEVSVEPERVVLKTASTYCTTCKGYFREPYEEHCVSSDHISQLDKLNTVDAQAQETTKKHARIVTSEANQCCTTASYDGTAHDHERVPDRGIQLNTHNCTTGENITQLAFMFRHKASGCFKND